MSYQLRVKNWAAVYENNRTRELKILNWVPLPNRMDGDSYTELVTHKDAAAHYGAWCAIISIASRQEPRGVLPRHGAEIPQALARISRLPATLFAAVLPRLEQMQWIERFNCDPAGECDNPAPKCDNPAGRCVEGKGREGKEWKEGNVSVSPSGSTKTQGTRFADSGMPVPWQLWSVNDLGWSMQRTLEVYEQFRDYWLAAAGAKARKADWFATWRNWCRNDRNGSRSRRQVDKDPFLERLDEMMAEEEAKERAATYKTASN